MGTNRKKIKPVKVTLSTHNYIDGYGGADIWLSWNKTSRKHKSRRHLGPCFHVKQASVQGIKVNEKMAEDSRNRIAAGDTDNRYLSPEIMLELSLEEIAEDKAILKRLETERYIFEPNEQQKGVSEVYMQEDYLTVKAAERCIRWLLATHYHLPVVTLKWEKKPAERKYWTPEWDEAEWRKNFE